MMTMPFLRRFPWLPTLGILTFSGAVALCNWLTWTPVERYYMGTYLRCSLFAIDQTSSAEVRWLYKTAPHDKQDLAMDADVVPAPAGGDGRIPLQLSRAARQSGWTDLVQGEGEWFPAARLQTFLQGLFYAGHSIWRVLLTPLLWGSAMFFSLLAGWSMRLSRSPSKRWDTETIDWGSPPPSLLQRWRTRIRNKTKPETMMAKIRLRLSKLLKRRTLEIRSKLPPAPVTAPADSSKASTQPGLPLFGSAMGAPSGKPKGGFRWEGTKGIE
jgi:hypothetical protein